MIWYKNNESDIVISTRIRLARNLDNVPFPNALSDKKRVIEDIKSAITNSNSTLSKELDYTDLDATAPAKKEQLASEHLISPQMLQGNAKGVFISKDKTMSIMLMEEDHIRLQVIMNGNKLREAYDTASKIDDVMEENLTYAFDEELGYLTACPTNAGTGLRASLMMHLPALTMTKSINRVVNNASSLGIAVRGLYGEGTRADGNLYQISNQVTMGISEEQIIEKLQNIAKQIIEMEEKARELLKEKSGAELSDKLWRSYGTLKYARKISSGEAMSLLSDVLLGQNMGIITDKGQICIPECMVLISPAFISNGKELNAEQRDIERAKFLRANV